MKFSKKFVLFGPPGIGKSTLVRTLGGFDLESIPQSKRLSFIKAAKPGIYAAADLNPENCPDDEVHWLVLTMSQDSYKQRRAQRDRWDVKKKEQPEMLVTDFSLPDDIGHTDVDVSGSIAEAVNNIKSALF